jgi:hypothetical protein
MRHKGWSQDAKDPNKRFGGRRGRLQHGQRIAANDGENQRSMLIHEYCDT